MNNLRIKDTLHKLGFNSKELLYITRWAEKESVSIINILEQLRIRFMGGIFLRLVIIAFCGLSVMNSSSGSLLASIITLVIGFIIIEIFAPLKVGAKTFFKFGRIKHHLE